MACTSIGTTPAVWAASTRNKHVLFAGDAADLADRLHGAEDVAGVRQATSRVFGVQRRPHGVGIDGAAAVGRQRVSG